jgi:hypothetical protein
MGGMEGCACPHKFALKAPAWAILSLFNPHFELPKALGTPAYKD